ncbi:hypothetical protein GQ53DRAFT_883558 [Thozetella sp. PMI_491]|nr:hypothetical protein GQ53DRAFT_883558 [Thozetella sp. PMI_491]
MHDLVLGHLARRGINAIRAAPASATPSELRQQLDEAMKRLRSPGATITILLTLIFFLVIGILMEYALRIVIGNLALAEDTSDDGYAMLELDGLLDDEDDEEVLVGKPKEAGRVSVDEDPEESKSLRKQTTAQKSPAQGSIVPQTRPVTKSFLTAIRHLRSVGGFKSLFRGFRAFLGVIMIVILVGVPFELAQPISPRYLNAFVDTLVSFLAAIPIHCAWTHATIRAPRPDGRYPAATRMPDRFGLALLPGASILPGFAFKLTTILRGYFAGVWSLHLILPSIRYALAYRLFFGGTMAITWGLDKVVEAGGFRHTSPLLMSALFLLAANIFWVVSGMLAVIPATIALGRVEASLLPEADQAVVPFDRTFGGRDACWKSKDISWWRYFVVNLGPLGAFKSFDREAYFRVAKLYGKFLFLVQLWAIITITVVNLELYAFVGNLYPLVVTAALGSMK